MYLTDCELSGLAETLLCAVSWVSRWSTCSQRFPYVWSSWLYSGNSLGRFGKVDNSCGVATWRNLVCSLLLRRWLLFHRSSPESVFTRTDLGDKDFTTFAGLVFGVFVQSSCSPTEEEPSLSNWFFYFSFILVSMLLYFSALCWRNICLAEMVGIRVRSFLFINNSAGLLPCWRGVLP